MNLEELARLEAEIQRINKEVHQYRTQLIENDEEVINDYVFQKKLKFMLAYSEKCSSKA
mgnify:CR=1 FL=1